jgi:glutamate---cysteine ligase / carboxylate-amine ligase
MPIARRIGVEEELHLVECGAARLAPLAPQVLHGLPETGFTAELQRSTVETNTEVCASLDELRRALLDRRAPVIEAAARLGLGVIASGTAPVDNAVDLDVSNAGRFVRMQQDYRRLVDEHLVCGAQVHVDVEDRDLAVRVLPRLERALPVLLALSASSPFWRGRDSGYASSRATVWQRWPTAGRAPAVSSYADYMALVEMLVDSGTVSDAKMMYFDVRPSVHLDTLELRVCDACPVVDDVVLVAALFRAAVERAVADERAGAEPPQVPTMAYRSAMWRAARSGTADSLPRGLPDMTPVPASEAVASLLAWLRPQLEEAGDWTTVEELAGAALARGTSADRQRACHAQRGSLADVVALLVAETAGGGDPAPAAGAAGLRLADHYGPDTNDEAVGPQGRPRPGYLPVATAWERLGPRRVEQREQALSRAATALGLSFRVEGELRPFPVDGFPRVISSHEWHTLAAGLTQRARALEAYLRDVYGEASILRDGAIPPTAVQRCGGWRPEARLLPDGAVRAPVMGFDLVRDGLGGWRVLEDNVRVPSGVAYAIAVARISRAAEPALRPPVALRDPDAVPALIAATLRAASPRKDPADPVVALLSEGSDNSAWFEHRLIAEEAGFLLARPDDVAVRDRQVVVRDQRVDVVYLRLESELVDLVDSSGRRIGRDLFQAACQGGVAVVNAPGNGVADDKELYCYVPEMITYYLGERPLLGQVATYRCADPEERAMVLDRLSELVTKPVGGYGGDGVLIGPRATPSELELRRRQIADDPEGWVAQETVALSTVPTLEQGRLQPRHVDLRAFVYLTSPGPGDAELAPVALTRVAPAGSMVVNSSRGGGAKDTWILADLDRSTGPAGPAEREGYVRHRR